ncbi:MAG TPA: hypothetical protein VF395_06020, partial [Polyangiaceae bacterium]
MGGDERAASELRQRLTESLSRFGVAGDVSVDAGRATLQGSGPTVTTDVAMLVTDWYGLSEELRQRRVNDAARRLAAERRAATGPSVPAPGLNLSAILGKVGIFLVVLLVGFGIRVSFKQWAALHPDKPASKPLIADYDAYERERAERAAHVCEATRSRVMRGATVGPSDVEGWVIELWALRSASKPSLVTDPVLRTFVSESSGQTRGRIV